MYTIVGLGNPGSEYERTRHNAGRDVVRSVAEACGVEFAHKKKPDHEVGFGVLSGEKVRFVLPNTFMNNSGKAVALYSKSVASAKKLIVVYDDIDLPLGAVRVAFGSSSGGHNGIKSLERALKTKQFIKVRLGVAKVSRGKAKKPVGEEGVVDYLLARFSKSEFELLLGAVRERALVALETTIETGDSVRAMNAVNGLPPAH